MKVYGANRTHERATGWGGAIDRILQFLKSFSSVGRRPYASNVSVSRHARSIRASGVGKREPVSSIRSSSESSGLSCAGGADGLRCSRHKTISVAYLVRDRSMPKKKAYCHFLLTNVRHKAGTLIYRSNDGPTRCDCSHHPISIIRIIIIIIIDIVIIKRIITALAVAGQPNSGAGNRRKRSGSFGQAGKHETQINERLR